MTTATAIETQTQTQTQTATVETIETATRTLDDDKLLESISMQDLLLYARDVSDKNDIFIPPSAKASKEDLINWISSNDPSHNPEAE